MKQPDIEQKLQKFKERLQFANGWSDVFKLNYLTLYRHILEAELVPEEELIRRAKNIKPLVRLTKDGEKRDDGQFADDDRLVFIKPCDIRQSYIYNFSQDEIVMENTKKEGCKPLTVPPLNKLAEFTCYHHYGGYYGFFRPGVDEVLAQIPQTVDLNRVSAFEIVVSSLDFEQVYDSMLDRHVTTVILYEAEGELPYQVRQQPVICNDTPY